MSLVGEHSAIDRVIPGDILIDHAVDWTAFHERQASCVQAVHRSVIGCNVSTYWKATVGAVVVVETQADLFQVVF